MDKRDSREFEGLSRREFLKRTGTILGGAALTSVPFLSACKSAASTTAAASAPASSSTTPASPAVTGGSPPAASTGPAVTTSSATVSSIPAMPTGSMAFIPQGSFEMGDHYGYTDPAHGGDETPLHVVSISAFYMSKNDVTAQEYCDYLNSALGQKSITVQGGAYHVSGGSKNEVTADDGLVYLVEGKDVLFVTRKAYQYAIIGWDGIKFSVMDNRGNHPATGMTWFGAAAYCNWLSAKIGYQACYNIVSWECDFTKNGFRLPTEAEWEYAARGGHYAPYYNYPWGNDADKTKANWPGSGDPWDGGPYPRTTPVGFFNGELRKKSDFAWPGAQDTYQTSAGVNAFGLADMAGNVWQWCNDWYRSDYYKVSASGNPGGPSMSEASLMPDGKPYRVLRGGNWYNGEPDVLVPSVDNGHSRVSNRDPAYYLGEEDYQYGEVGFRLVRRDSSGSTAVPPPTTSTANRTVGLFINDPRAWPGYTLMAPKQYTSTYLLNNKGQAVHAWKASKYPPGQWGCLLENGHLMRAATTHNDQINTGGGEGGRIEEYDWDDNLVWQMDFSTDTHMQHHDFVVLPNGNLLMLVVEKKTFAEAVAAGIDPSRMPDVQKMGYILPDAVYEVKPTRPVGGTIVWTWSVWDHLVQDFSSSKANYGVVSAHPELADPNSGRQIPVFWNHMNSITYHAGLDQVMLSVRGNSEFWVIDHSTSTAEAAGHAGGKCGNGGDILYRWGNPVQYRAGTAVDQMLFQQHCAMWIASNCPGAGDMLVFNNGIGRNYTTIDQVTPPVDATGHYSLSAGSAFGPKNLTWTYKANPPDSFYAAEISGAQRLPNGNTLICDGDHGMLFEVTSSGEVVWKYVNPVVKTGPLGSGDTIPPDTAKQDQLLNEVFRVQRYPLDYAGLAGRDLASGAVIEK